MDNDKEILKSEGMLTLQGIKNACQVKFGTNGEEEQICEITSELQQGIDLIEQYQHIATIYGSARLTPEHPMYKSVEEMAYRLSKEQHYEILTGGGGGIMEAGNAGAHRAGGVSVAATIILPHEQKTNPYATSVVPFNYFFTRKVVLRYATKLAIYCPGGLGTFDELFEVLTLTQTKKKEAVPVILFGTKFWNPVDALIKNVLQEEFETISPEDRRLYIITDDVETVLELAQTIAKKNERPIE